MLPDWSPPGTGTHGLSRQLPPGWAAEKAERSSKWRGGQPAFLSDPSVAVKRGQRAQLWLDIHEGGRWAGPPALGEAQASGKEATDSLGDKGQGLNHHFTSLTHCVAFCRSSLLQSQFPQLDTRRD